MMSKAKTQYVVGVLMAVGLSFAVSSCDSNQNAVQDLLVLRADIKEHCVDYSESEWEDAFNRYMSICERLDKMPFTQAERMEINKIKGEIAGYAATVAAQEITDEIKNIADEMNSFSKGFGETFQEPKIRNEYD